MAELIIPKVGSPPEWTGPLRQLERVILDPITESIENAPLELTGRDGGHGIWLVSHSYPPGERKSTWAGSPESIGERRVGNGLPSNRAFPYTVYVAEEQSIGESTNRATNPKAALDTDDWIVAGTGGATVNRAVFSARSLLLDPIPYPNGAPAETGLYFLGHAENDRLYLPWATASDRIYTISAFLYVQELGGADGFRLHIRDDTGAIRAGSDLFSTTGVWERLDVSYFVDSAADWRASLTQVGDGDTVAVLTALLIENSSSVNPYFDGDTPGCFFNAGRHASVSTRRGAGGKRFTGAMHDLEQKIEKLASEGGTVKRVLPSGDEIVFDVAEATGLGEWAKPFNQNRQEVTFSLTCRPFGRGNEVALTDHAETVLPVAIGTDTVEQASARSLGRLVVDDDDAEDRLYVVWGVQSRYYDPAASADLFYQAESRTAKNGAVVGALAGASGGSVMKQNSLNTTWAAMLTTQESGGASHTHVGSYRMIARCYLPAGNTGRVAAALQWAIGDFAQFTTNEPVRFKADDPRQGTFVLADLGIVTIPEAAAGAQRWEGRIIAKSSTLGDGLYVDCYALIPIDEASGELNTAEPEVEIPTAFLARDEFNQAAGDLDTKALPVGGTWHEAHFGGPADNWSRSIPAVAGRAGSTSDTDETQGHFLVSTDPAGLVAVQADFWLVLNETDTTPGRPRLGVVARFTDTSNWLYAVIRPDEEEAELRIYRCVAGTIRLMESGYIVGRTGKLGNRWHTVRLAVDTKGHYWAWVGNGGDTEDETNFDSSEATAQVLDLAYAGQHSSLATGGALASGRSGIYSAQRDDNPSGHLAANWLAFTPTVDAAIFASQSMEVRHDRVVRENSAGTFWGEKPEYRGDYCTLPPAGREQRTLRTIVLASQSDPTFGSDAGIDDTSFRLHLTPQFDVVPEPSS